MARVRLRPDYPVVTERLRLRPLTAADIDALLAYRGDPEVCRYLPFDPQTRQRLTERLAGPLGATEISAAGQGLTLGVTRHDDERVIGDILLFFKDEANRGGELGYVFNPEVAGLGYATEACSAVLGLAFEALGLNRVIARIDGRNTASARLAQRLGMRQEAHFVENEIFKGEWADELIFAMLAREWQLR